MTDPENDLMEELDGLSDWIRRRERIRRAVASLYLVAASACGTLALLGDEWVFLPLLPLAGAVVWLFGVWAADRWWQASGARADEAVVWADVAWVLAARRPLPQGWPEKGMPGTLHRSADAWLWRPSTLFAPQVEDLRWPLEDIAIVTTTPLPSLLPPPRAQLRLYLRIGGSVDLLVRHSSRLGQQVDHQDGSRR
jgi:hypothetical protein